MNVKVERFEGPIDLLYSLIQKNKVDIKDIPIAIITEQYLDYINNMQELEMENMSEFLVIAAELLKIKSKMLLPKDEVDEEEDPRDNLVKRLLEYKKYKQAAEQLCLIQEDNKILIKAVNDIEKYITYKKINPEDVLKNITINQLTNEFKKILRTSKNKVDNVRHSFEIIKKDVYTIEDRMIFIKEKLNIEKQFTFKSLFIDLSLKMEKVVTFLAILELIKQKELVISQQGMFSDIIIGAVVK